MVRPLPPGIRLPHPQCLYKAPYQRNIHRLPSPRHRNTPSTIFPKPSKPFHPRIRCASTSQTTTAAATSNLTARLKNILLGTGLTALLGFSYLYITDVRAGIHQWAVVPSLRWVYDDAEEAHEVGTKMLKGLWEWGLYPRERGKEDDKGDLSVEIFGRVLKNPISTSAGIDKHADIIDPLFAIGASIVEVGGCTPQPQDGNPKPRVWRLPSQKAMINRYGLNSEGVDFIVMRLRQRVREYAFRLGLGVGEEGEQRVLDGEAGVPGGSLQEGRLLAVQVAKNSTTPSDDVEAVKADYVYCVDAVARYADIIVVNVSSPNTIGLRNLQRVEPLTNILTGVVEAAKRASKKTKPAVMVKVSPDEDSEEQIGGICDAVWESGVDGVIVGNTTKRRHDLLPMGYSLPNREAAILLEEGGYSGPQLFERTLALTRRYRVLLDEGLERQTEPEPEPESKSNPSQTPKNTIDDNLSAQIEATTARDAKNLKPDTPEAEAESKSQPLIRLPARNNPFSADDEGDSGGAPALSADHHVKQIPPVERSTPESTAAPKPKVVFSTGGISNGQQALEVLAAGANVAQIYTALVYGGIGTLHFIKSGMRDEMKKVISEKDQ